MSKTVRHQSPAQKNSTQRLRIIGGEWRSRIIQFPAAEGLRPTGDRIRETLFNWLAPYVSGANCLDLFAGSGILGLEALSRGAQHCTAIELNPQAAKQLQNNKQLLQASKLEIIEGNAMRFIGEPASAKFDLVFLDPPFADNRIEQVCRQLEDHHWLACNAWIYCEQPADRAHFATPENWRLHRNKSTGGVNCQLFSRIERLR